MKKWYKNGAAYNGPKMSAAWYRGNGYSDEAPPEPEAVPEVKRYSKLALHDALGDDPLLAGQSVSIPQLPYSECSEY